MDWIKGLLASIKAALVKVADTSGVLAVSGWLKGLSAPAWLATGGGWVGKGLSALWRSFWAVWGNPMTYPIIGAIAFGMFMVGHHEGRRPVAGAEAARFAAERERDAAVKTARDAGAKLTLAAARIAALEKEPASPAVIAPAPKPRAHRAKPAATAPAPKSSGFWTW